MPVQGSYYPQSPGQAGTTLNVEAWKPQGNRNRQRMWKSARYLGKVSQQADVNAPSRRERQAARAAKHDAHNRESAHEPEKSRARRTIADAAKKGVRRRRGYQRALDRWRRNRGGGGSSQQQPPPPQPPPDDDDDSPPPGAGNPRYPSYQRRRQQANEIIRKNKSQRARANRGEPPKYKEDFAAVAMEVDKKAPERLKERNRRKQIKKQGAIEAANMVKKNQKRRKKQYKALKHLQWGANT